LKAEALVYLLLRSLLRALGAFPRLWTARLARPLGLMWHHVDAYHRRIAGENMASAFAGEHGGAWVAGRVRANFVQLVRVMLELPSLYRMTAGNVDAYARLRGAENLKEAVARAKGVLILTAHLGNWELMALAASLRLHIQIHVVVRPLDFAPLDRILSELRSRTGNVVLDKDKSANAIGGLLRENRIVGILLDQNASWYEGVYVPFFGRTACTNKGLALFALRYGAAVVPAHNVRSADGRYTIVLEPALSLIRTGDLRKDVEVNTALFNTVIERWVRTAPEQWLWIHRRWRIKDIPDRARRKLETDAVR